MKAWTLTTLLTSKIVVPGGVFSTREKAEEAAKREREEITRAAHLDGPIWEPTETIYGCIWSNGMWDVISESGKWTTWNPNPVQELP